MADPLFPLFPSVQDLVAAIARAGSFVVTHRSQNPGCGCSEIPSSLHKTENAWDFKGALPLGNATDGRRLRSAGNVPSLTGSCTERFH